jgi:hypothetical protein
LSPNRPREDDPPTRHDHFQIGHPPLPLPLKVREGNFNTSRDSYEAVIVRDAPTLDLKPPNPKIALNPMPIEPLPQGFHIATDGLTLTRLLPRL